MLEVRPRPGAFVLSILVSALLSVPRRVSSGDEVANLCRNLFSVVLFSVVIFALNLIATLRGASSVSPTEVPVLDSAFDTTKISQDIFDLLDKMKVSVIVL